jgi:hypothetical protein
MDSPITKLVNDILRNIFEQLAQDPDASLVPSILTCKRWHPLARSALYRDIFLSPGRLSKFLDHGAAADSPSTTTRTRSLTLRTDLIRVNPYDTSEAARTAIARLDALARLQARIKQDRHGMMSSLTSLSLTADIPLPLTASRLVASILRTLPPSCTSLEIDIKHNNNVDAALSSSQGHHIDVHRHRWTVHLCQYVRPLLAQLVHLRLRHLEICPAMFGSSSDQHCSSMTTTDGAEAEAEAGEASSSNSSDIDDYSDSYVDRDVDGTAPSYRAAAAPNLQTCIINLCIRDPGPSDQGAFTTRCSDAATQIPLIGSLTTYPSALSSLLPALQAFVRHNSAPESESESESPTISPSAKKKKQKQRQRRLRRLWIIDAQPLRPTAPHAWPAWVRRDVLRDESFPVPLGRIGGLIGGSSWMVRAPLGSSEVEIEGEEEERGGGGGGEKDDRESVARDEEKGAVEDWIAPGVEQLEGIVEGSTWSTSATGVRMPTKLLLTSVEHAVLAGRLLRRAEYRGAASCTLWQNEQAAGEKLKLLPTGPGRLMQAWDVHERTPNGWRRDDALGAPLVRV